VRLKNLTPRKKTTTTRESAHDAAGPVGGRGVGRGSSALLIMLRIMHELISRAGLQSFENLPAPAFKLMAGQWEMYGDRRSPFIRLENATYKEESQNLKVGFFLCGSARRPETGGTQENKSRATP